MAGQTAAGVSEEQQATYLEQAYHSMAENPYVQVALWVPARGRRRRDFRAAAHQRITQALIWRDAGLRPGRRLAERALWQFHGAKITVASPANHVRYSGPLPIHVTAKSSAGVFRIRLEWDGTLIRNYDGNGLPKTLFGALDWQGAKHIHYGWIKLSFIAYDKANNVSETNIRVYHARPHRGKHH
jgi:hypothetical protein